MITKKIKHKDSTGFVHEYDIGADAKNISEDQTHRFVSDSDKEKWDDKLDSDGNASFVTALFEPTTGGRINIFSKDTLATMCSKIAKWFADLKNHSFADLIQNATTADTTRAVSAAVAKNLQDQISAQNTKLSKQEPFAWSGNATFGTDGIAVIPCDKNVKACSLLGTPIMYGEFLSFTFSASGGRILCRGLTGSQTVSGTIWLSVLGFVEYI